MKRAISERLRKRALAMIARGSDEWHDFCSHIGQIPGNIAHMRGVQDRFCEYLEGNE